MPFLTKYFVNSLLLTPTIYASRRSVWVKKMSLDNKSVIWALKGWIFLINGKRQYFVL